MTVLEPLPVNGYGKGSWIDYSNYWRDDDTDWLQERSILRYADATFRGQQYGAPKFGQVTYNEATDRLELWSKGQAAWAQIPLWVNLISTTDTASAVTLSHKGSTGKGLIFGPGVGTAPNAAGLLTMNAPIDVLTGLFTVGGVNGTNVGIKTGTKQVKLTTDATGLVVDSPVSATALSTSGALTAASATITSLTAPNISMTGTLTGGVLNGSSGLIGGVTLSGNRATASSGFLASGGLFSGDGGSTIMRLNGGGPYLQVSGGGAVYAGGGQMDFYNNIRMISANIVHYNTGRNYAPSFYSGGDPGAGNFPDGTIWIN